MGSVDTTGKSVPRWGPPTGERQQWAVPDFPSAVVLRRGGVPVAMRDGLYSSTWRRAASACSATPRPTGRPTAPTNPVRSRRG